MTLQSTPEYFLSHCGAHWVCLLCQGRTLWVALRSQTLFLCLILKTSGRIDLFSDSCTSWMLLVEGTFFFALSRHADVSQIHRMPLFPIADLKNLKLTRKAYLYAALAKAVKFFCWVPQNEKICFPFSKTGWCIMEKALILEPERLELKSQLYINWLYKF